MANEVELVEKAISRTFSTADLIIIAITSVALFIFILYQMKIWQWSPRIGREEKHKKSDSPCDFVQAVDACLHVVKRTQAQHIILHQQTKEGLAKGEAKFDAIWEELTYLGKGMTLLLDKAGYDTEDWRRRPSGK